MPQWRRTLRFTVSVSAAVAATVLCLNFIIAARSFGQTSHIAADPELQEVIHTCIPVLITQPLATFFGSAEY